MNGAYMIGYSSEIWLSGADPWLSSFRGTVTALPVKGLTCKVLLAQTPTKCSVLSTFSKGASSCVSLIPCTIA